MTPGRDHSAQGTSFPQNPINVKSQMKGQFSWIINMDHDKYINRENDCYLIVCFDGSLMVNHHEGFMVNGLVI